jgi:hypothetical protein
VHVQQDEPAIPADSSPDGADRIRDFLARHGGAGTTRRAGQDHSGMRGWYEVYAADGYTLRCEWSRTGGLEELKYAEVAPRS